QWAYEIYFAAAGTAELYAGAATAVATFNYPKDQWFFIENNIDLDADWTKLYVDGNLIHEWQFSVLANGGTGEKQLGGMDLFAGAPTGQTPRFYMDDLTFSGGGGIGNPIIAVTPPSLNETLQGGATSTQTLAIQNQGEQDLTYNILITYQGGPTLANVTGAASKKDVVLNIASVSPSPTNGGSPPLSDDVILHYDGDNFSAIGLTGGGEMKCAAMFPAAMVNPYIGMDLTSMEVYINDAPNSTKMLVYNYGLPNLPGPGALLYEQTWSFTPEAWNTVNMTFPVMVEGGDLWVGYLVDHAASTFPAGTDGGPANPNGDWISTGPGWSHLSGNPALDYNWNIRAHLTGNPLTQWLSVSPVTGTVAVGGSQNIDVTFNAAGLASGTYHATIVVQNNDPNNSSVAIPVTLIVDAGYQVALKVFMEGPFETTQMNSYLAALPEFPLSQPYNVSPWFYTGSENIASVPNPDIVDWVLVELRDAASASAATGATMIEQQAGFVLKNGSVVSVDGFTPMSFTVEPVQSLFAIIQHRNHLDIMSANPLTPSGNSYSYDYTTGVGQVFGGALGHKQLAAGIWGMIGGDGLPDGQVGNSDKVDIWVPQSGNSGYYFGDFSLDGQVNNLDKVEVWMPNGGSGSQVPDMIYQSQVPE
ncbi:MAG: hypothetical protein JXA03_02380, partial [Bacteroidales bacterium]|nr:hypothetical protein [Bacteroidales bacterium]